MDWQIVLEIKNINTFSLFVLNPSLSTLLQSLRKRQNICFILQLTGYS